MNFYASAAAFIAFGVTALTGFWLIPFLKRLKYGQTILEEGPKWHMAKQNTPTMGGVMFIIGITAALLVGFNLVSPTMSSEIAFNRIQTVRFIAGYLMAVGFGFIGFIDDYVKVVKKRNLGLTARQKLLLQFGVSIFYLATVYAVGDTSTVLFIPFFGQIDIGVFYYPLCVLGITYITNSVNLTDGLDGLAASVTFVASLGFMAVSLVLGYTYVNLMSAATAAACVGFLIWNFYPAKVFMGDTGSMFLGGMVVAMAFGLGQPLLIGLIGIIYIVESLSVVIQVISFKLTGKRVFKMSPIHHHYEMSGMKEVQIVFAFTAVTAVGSVIAFIAVMNM